MFTCNKIMWRLQQRFKSELHNVFTDKVNKMALRSNDDKRLQSFSRVKSYPYKTSVGKVYKEELLEHVKIASLNTKDDQLWWFYRKKYRNTQSELATHSWSSIQGINNQRLRSGSRKTIAVRNLINHQPDIDKIYLYAKDPHEAKY